MIRFVWREESSSRVRRQQGNKATKAGIVILCLFNEQILGIIFSRIFRIPPSGGGRSVGRTIITGCRRPLSPFAHPSSASQYTNSLNRILWLRSACVSLALYARRLGRAPIKRSHQKNILGCILISKLVRMGERGARGRNGQRECAHFAKKEWWFAYRSRATGFARVIINIIMSMYSEHYHYT